MEPLARIQRLVALRRFRFTRKAREELDSDGLVPIDALESVLNADTIHKRLKSIDRFRIGRREILYVIQACNNTGTLVYTKGKFARRPGATAFHLFISAKRWRSN